MPDVNALPGFIASDLLEVSELTVVGNPELTQVDRRDVGQGDLAKVTLSL